MTRTPKHLKKLTALNEELKASGYEVVLRKIPTKEVVAFDVGLIFTRDSGDVQLYLDNDVKDVLNEMLKKSEQLFLKVNWFSPDLIVVAPEVALQGPQDAPGSMETTDPVS